MLITIFITSRLLFERNHHCPKRSGWKIQEATNKATLLKSDNQWLVQQNLHPISSFYFLNSCCICIYNKDNGGQLRKELIAL